MTLIPSHKLARGIALSALLALAACGYRPLYAVDASGSSVADELAEINVEQQSTRVGQLVRNEIVRSTRPVGTVSEDRYVLKLAPVERVETLINDRDTVHRRLAYRLVTRFQLIDLASRKPVFAGQAVSRVSYDRVSASFSNVQARVNAQEQAAKEVGNEVKTRLAAYLASN